MKTASVTRIPIAASPKVLNRQGRTRDRILLESARSFLDKGFENVSVEDIVAAAEIARSSFYRFFANREEVLASIIRPVFERGLQEMQAISPRAPRQIMDGIFDMYLTLWHSGAEALRLSTRMGGDYFRLFQDLHYAYREHLSSLVQKVEPAGILLNGNADYTARLIARSAVPVMEIYRQDENFEELFRRTMSGLLLRNGEIS